jgi:transposase-like protein
LTATKLDAPRRHVTGKRKGTRRRWTEAERARLVKLAGSGITAEAIAAELDRSTSAVHQKLAALRTTDSGVPTITAPRWTPAEDAELVRAVGTGESAASVARRLGRTPRAAQARHRKLTGTATPPRRWTPEEDARLIAGDEKGATYAQLAQRLRRSPSAIAERAAILRRRDDPPLTARRPRWTDERRRELARRRTEGASLRELEHEFGVTRGTLTAQLRTLRRLGYLTEPGPRQGEPATKH